jgi:hypothetical protein
MTGTAGQAPRTQACRRSAPGPPWSGADASQGCQDARGLVTDPRPICHEAAKILGPGRRRSVAGSWSGTMPTSGRCRSRCLARAPGTQASPPQIRARSAMKPPRSRPWAPTICAVEEDAYIRSAQEQMPPKDDPRPKRRHEECVAGMEAATWEVWGVGWTNSMNFTERIRSPPNFKIGDFTVYGFKIFEK